MVGIAAGIAHKNEVDQIYGDVVVPDIVWDYSSGKFVSASNASLNFGGIGFIPRPHFVSTDGAMLEAVERAMHSKENVGSVSEIRRIHERTVRKAFV